VLRSRGELSLVWSTPPWFLEKQAPLRALGASACRRRFAFIVSRVSHVADVSSDVAGDAAPDDAVVTASLQVDPVGGGYYVRGRCEVAPPPRRSCACCGALHDAPLEALFQVWCVPAHHARAWRPNHARAPCRLTDSPAERRSGSRRSARRGPASDSAAGPGADDEVLLFGRNASGVDLSGVVRDALLLAAPAAPRCAAPDCAAPHAPAPPAPPPGGSNAFGALAALRERLSANPPPKA